MSREEIEEKLIYDEYFEYAKKEYSPLNFTSWLLEKTIKARIELRDLKQQEQ
jgi:hypothetical protein